MVSLAFVIIFMPSILFAADGALKWTFTPAGTNISHPAIATDGTLYIGSVKNYDYNFYVYAINPNGTQKWVSPPMPYMLSDCGFPPQPVIAAFVSIIPPLFSAIGIKGK